MAKGADEVGSTANRYRILAKLAVGGMAEIFLARGASVTGVERYCVLKRIPRERTRDAELVRMFLDEARLAAQLQHPNIAQVFDIGMLGESYFFTMEYVHGQTVRSLLARAHELGRALPPGCVLSIIAGAAAGLHHAHERNSADGRPLGIVHRDVSPSNLMVSYEGHVKLVDFGIAKATDRAVETRSGLVKGKISYLSPEQCRGAKVDRRSDLFSLGIVMWEMLTGSRLYRRTSDFDNMSAIVHEHTPPPSRFRPDMPKAIEAIALRLLAKSADDRFQTAAELVEAIENAAMRIGTTLSASAVRQLMREVFPMRREPWLALDDETAPAGDPDTLERELATLPDLSALTIAVDCPTGATSLADEANETREAATSYAGELPEAPAEAAARPTKSLRAPTTPDGIEAVAADDPDELANATRPTIKAAKLVAAVQPLARFTTSEVPTVAMSPIAVAALAASIKSPGAPVQAAQPHLPPAATLLGVTPSSLIAGTAGISGAARQSRPPMAIAPITAEPIGAAAPITPPVRRPVGTAAPTPGPTAMRPLQRPSQAPALPGMPALIAPSVSPAATPSAVVIASLAPTPASGLVSLAPASEMPRLAGPFPDASTALTRTRPRWGWAVLVTVLGVAGLLAIWLLRQ